MHGYQQYTLSKSTLKEIFVGILTCFIISMVAGTLYIELRIYLGLALPWSWVMKFVVTRGGTRPFWFVKKMPDLLRWSSCITCIWKIRNLRALSLYNTFKSRFQRIQPVVLLIHVKGFRVVPDLHSTIFIYNFMPDYLRNYKNNSCWSAALKCILYKPFTTQK